jgi:thiol:disulfide interchange protein DsbD
VRLTSLNDFKKWEPHQTQEFKIQVELPVNFHAYLDQFKVLNLKPEGFKAGEIHIQPEVEFYDKFSKKNRKGLTEKGIVSILIEAGDTIPTDLKIITFDLRHQICSESVCYLPKNLPLEIHLASAGLQMNNQETATETGPSLSEKFQNSLQTNLFLAFVLVFFAGVLTSFTPCIFPMLPITISILGYHANKGNRFHNLARAVSYVLGIAMTYSILGVIAALTGQLFGSALTNKYILATLCFLFVLMALSMWDVFELQVPAFIRNRFGTGKSHGLSGAFVMGLVAGVVASPCVGPVLVSILSFVSTTRNAFLGFSLLFTFAIGLGLIFIFIGLFSHSLHLLPKSGAWMNLIKFILGSGMWVAALYYAQFLVMHRWWVALVAASFWALAIWKGAFHFRKKNYIRQSFLLALFVFSSSVLILSFTRPEYLTPAFQLRPNASQNETQIQWIPFSEKEILAAQTESKPVLLDFYADWCGACHELEEKTYTNPEFAELAKQFKLIKFDATDDTPENQKILQKYNVKGLPTVIFINKKGDLLNSQTFTQFIDWSELKPKMQESLK